MSGSHPAAIDVAGQETPSVTVPQDAPGSAEAQLSAAESPRPRVAILSLYEGDNLNRAWAMIGLGPRRPAHLAWRALLLPLITWLPTALLAIRATPAALRMSVGPTNFFADFAAYAQFWVGLPLFVVAEAIISVSTRSAAIEFAESGVIRTRDLPRLDGLHRRFTRVQRSGWGDLVCLALAALLSFATIRPELQLLSPQKSWHTFGTGHLSAPGLWEFFVALPLLNYWWLRHIWKVLLWWLYLRALSRFRLDLVATHPDRTGGIGFVSSVQGHFAWLLLAYGITNVAATVGYELGIEHVDWWAPPVWGPVVGFVIGAPLLFLLPLFMFTRQLYRAKRSARRLYRRRVMEQARLFEAELLPKSAAESTTVSGVVDLSLMTQFSRLFEATQEMRVVPFDLRSASQLVASTFGTVASILPALHLQQPVLALAALVQKLVAFLSQAPH
jgi:hypothetical protein